MRKRKIINLAIITVTIGIIVGLSLAFPDENTNAPVTPKEEPKKTEAVTTAKPKPIVILQKDFDKTNKISTDYKSYKDGKFKFKDGTIVKADYVNYVGGSFYEDASAIFYEGKLVKIQVEGVSISVDSIIKGLGIGSLPEDADVKENGTGDVIDIALDPKFSDSNIAVLPNE